MLRLKESTYLTIDFDSANQLMIHTWLPTTADYAFSDEQIMDGMKDIVNSALQVENIRFFLSDTTHLGRALTSELDKESSATIMPILLGKGVQKIAIVLSQVDLFASVSVEQVIDSLSEKHEAASPSESDFFRTFQTLAEARAWLLS